MQTEHHVFLIKNGSKQALYIPKDFELPGEKAIISKYGDCLIIKPVKHRSLLAILATIEPLDENFPDVDKGLLPLDDIEL